MYIYIYCDHYFQFKGFKFNLKNGLKLKSILVRIKGASSVI